MEPLSLSHTEILPPTAAVLVSRSLLDTRRPRRLHRQDFPELLWVQNGQLRLHLENQKLELSEGDLVFLPPNLAHGVQGRGEDPVAVSISFSPSVADSLRKRHPNLKDRLFWSNDPVPERIHRDARQLSDLNQSAKPLEAGSTTALDAEAFLTPLCAAVLSDTANLPTDVPDWLRRACIAARKQEVFSGGASAFAAIAGKAHPHVSRTARKFLDMSPSDYVNQQRMIFAAQRLVGTSDTLSEIASACGIPNLSHFHKIFRAHHGITPQKYRKAHQRDVFQPD